ncbi:MAG: hypothetical protein QM699_13360 [Amaricoccus sp.]
MSRMLREKNASPDDGAAVVAIRDGFAPYAGPGAIRIPARVHIFPPRP